MELVLHFIYVVAMSKAEAWSGLTPMQIAMMGYFNLHIIWLKLLIPWRFFRLWAMADGMETTENMIRCMSNNYSALAFWRAWHRSFNRWILRYIYIPLSSSSSRTPSSSSPSSPSSKERDGTTGRGGGGGVGVGVVRTLVNMATVFTFVAIWHDISLTLLTWGWLVVVFLIPEILVTQVARPWRGERFFRPLCALGGVLNILAMMAANLVGFSVGVSGLKSMAAQLFGASSSSSLSGVVFLGTAAAALFVGVQVMFEVREDEAARGIHLRC